MQGLQYGMNIWSDLYDVYQTIFMMNEARCRIATIYGRVRKKSNVLPALWRFRTLRYVRNDPNIVTSTLKAC